MHVILMCATQELCQEKHRFGTILAIRKLRQVAHRNNDVLSLYGKARSAAHGHHDMADFLRTATLHANATAAAEPALDHRQEAASRPSYATTDSQARQLDMPPDGTSGGQAAKAAATSPGCLGLVDPTHTTASRGVKR